MKSRNIIIPILFLFTQIGNSQGGIHKLHNHHNEGAVCQGLEVRAGEDAAVATEVVDAAVTTLTELELFGH